MLKNTIFPFLYWAQISYVNMQIAGFVLLFFLAFSLSFWGTLSNLINS